MSSHSRQTDDKNLRHRERALSTPEIPWKPRKWVHRNVNAQYELQSPHLARNNSSGLLDLSQNRQNSAAQSDKNWFKHESKNSKLSKSTPNFQDILRHPVDKLNSVEPENEYFVNGFRKPAFLTVKSLSGKRLRKSNSSLDLGTMDLFDGGSIAGTPHCSRTNTPIKPLSSRSRLLKPIPNAPTANIPDKEGKDRISPTLFKPSVLVTPSSGTPQLEPMKENVSYKTTHSGVSVTEKVSRQKLFLDPIVSPPEEGRLMSATEILEMGTSKQYNVADDEDCELFHAKPHADVLLHLCYCEKHSLLPSTFTSMPKNALNDSIHEKPEFDQRSENSGPTLQAETASTASKTLFDHTDLLDENANYRYTYEYEENQLSYVAEAPYENCHEKLPSHQKSSVWQGDTTTNAAEEETTQTIFVRMKNSPRTKDNIDIVQKKPYVTLDVSSILSQQTSQSWQDKNHTSDVGYDSKVNYKPAPDTLVDSAQDSTVPVSADKLADFQLLTGSLAETGNADDVPTKKALPPKAVEAVISQQGVTSSVRRRKSSATSKFQAGFGKAKNVGNLLSKPREKSGVQMGSKPPATKPKKFKPIAADKPKAKVTKKNVYQKTETGISSKIKKGLEYEVKTERLMHHMEEKFNSFSVNPMQHDVDTGTAISANLRAVCTPVIHEAYPKIDEDEEKLLQKVKVTVTSASHPRRVKSSVPKKSRPQLTHKRGKNRKGSDYDDTMLPESGRNGKFNRASSAAPVVENSALKNKTQKHTQDGISQGGVNMESIDEFETAKQTIFSGKDWHVLASKGKADEKCSNRHLMTAGEDFIDGPSLGINRSREPILYESDLRLISPIDHSPCDIQNTLKDETNSLQWSTQASRCIDDTELQLDYFLVNENTDREPTGFTQDSLKGIKLKDIDANFQSVSRNHDSPNELDIEVIKLPDDHLSMDIEQKDENIIGETQERHPDNFLIKGQGIILPSGDMEDDLPATGAEFRNIRQVTSTKFFDKSVPVAEQKVQIIWTSDDSDPEDEEETDEDTLDLHDNLQKMMRSMRQRSELDAHTLKNYKNSEKNGDSTVSSDKGRSSEYTSLKGRYDVTSLEDGVLPLLFGEIFTLEPASSDIELSGRGLEAGVFYSPNENERNFDEDAGMSQQKSLWANDEPSDSESSHSTIIAEGKDVELREERPFEAYLSRDFEMEEFNDSSHNDSDEEDIIEEMRKTLNAASLSEPENISDKHANGDSSDVSDSFANFSFNGPKLTEETLHKHNQQLQRTIVRKGASASLYDINPYKPCDRNAIASRTSNCTRTTDWSENTETTIKSELDTAACLGWRKGRELGHGSYGTVFEGLTRYGQLIAVKIIELTVSSRETAEKEFKQVQAEVDLLKTLRHDNIVRLLGTTLVGSTVQIFMEHIAGGSIAALLMQYGPLKERIFRHYSKQILTGVEYLHSSSVVHRDIKGSNIMLMTAGIIKLIDFGCAKRLKENSLKKQSDTSEDGNFLQSVRGTPYWMAPEVITSQGHGQKSDIWSIGCTVYEMATTNPPLRELEPAAAIFHIGDGNEMPLLSRPGISKHAVDFVRQCLVREPQSRPTASSLLQHKFILHKKKGRIYH